MLYIVLILVLGALGLLVTALVTAQSLWAWVSIGLSAVAGLLLVVDLLRRRARGAATGEPGQGADAGPAREAGPPGGAPDEEKSAPADVEVVSELAVDVVVVDEYPHYHLTGCGWLAGRVTIPISVKEARSLGFTPCARCAPNAHLAATHRASA